MDDFLFFNCSSAFYFLSIEFQCYFSVSYKKSTILSLLLLYFDLVVIGRRDFFVSSPLYLSLYSCLSLTISIFVLF